MDYTANLFDQQLTSPTAGFTGEIEFSGDLSTPLLDRTQYFHDFGFDYETTGLIDEIFMQEWFQPIPGNVQAAEPMRSDVVQIESIPIYTTLCTSLPIVDETTPIYGQISETPLHSTQFQSDSHQTNLQDTSLQDIPKESVTVATATNRSNEFLCPECGQSFPSKRSLSNHKRTHLIRTTFTCVLCEQEFSVRRQLQLHLREHKSSSGKAISGKGRIRKSEAFKCEMCFSTFDTRNSLLQHKSRTHSRPTESPENATNSQTCPVSEPIIAIEPIQLKPRPKRVQCKHTDCNQFFDNVQLLRRHQTIHRLKRFRCSSCRRVYHSKPVFQTHVRLCQPKSNDCVLLADEDIDSGPMECRLCGQLFENKRVLRFHGQFCVDEKAEQAEASRARELREQLGLSVADVVIKQEILE